MYAPWTSKAHSQVRGALVGTGVPRGPIWKPPLAQKITTTSAIPASIAAAALATPPDAWPMPMKPSGRPPSCSAHCMW